MTPKAGEGWRERLARKPQSVLGRLAWFAAIYVAGLLAFALVVLALRALVPR